MDNFLDWIWSLYFLLHKLFNIIFFNAFYYIVRYVLLHVINFLNTVFANKFIIKFLNIRNTIRDLLVHYNTRIFKWRKRYAMYFRFGKFKNIRSLFYITFFIILVYIWQNRNLYRNNFPILYYMYYLLSFMFLSIFINGLIDEWFLSEILALFISFICIKLTLK